MRLSGLLLLLCLSAGPLQAIAADQPQSCIAPGGAQVWIPGGRFVMGSDSAYPEEGPAREVTLDGFWMDVHEVTNAQFAAFVQATGHVTVAERRPDPQGLEGAPPEMLEPGSVTFTPPTLADPVGSWWSWTPGADWRHPDGPGSSIAGRENYPVVHLAWEDAAAYAAWAGRELPTEAQFEFAARSKRNAETYAWGGTEVAPGGTHQANTWQGFFPVQNSADDGFAAAAPVGCFAPNAYGIYDLIGNVWEWTADWYAPRHDPTDTRNPRGPPAERSFDPNNAGFPVRVIKGGSYLCAPNYCKRYRPSARHAQDTMIGAAHIGFRTVSNRAEAAQSPSSRQDSQ